MTRRRDIQLCRTGGNVKSEMKDKWVKALRSGKYRQGATALRRKRGFLNLQREYCCLGVLCDIAIKETGVGKWMDIGHEAYQFGNDREASVAYPPVNLMELVGLSREETTYLITLNDQLRYTFDQIADVIESGHILEHTPVSNE